MLKLPGLIDPHVHVREPGQTHKEDWDTATQSALAGGITTILAMPNTKPPIFDEATLDLALNAARQKARCDYGQFLGAGPDNGDWDQGRGNASRLPLRAAGLKMYLDSTFGELRLDDMTLWMTHFQTFPKDLPIVLHSEARTMAAGILFAAIYDRPVHIAHISLREEVLLIKAAKARGIQVTCEVAPQHLFLSKDDIPAISHGHPGRGEVRPRLATKADVNALWENLDVIDCFATDHAPHTLTEKDSETPPPGFPGLETMLPLLLNASNVKSFGAAQRRLTLNVLIEKMYTNPRKIFNLPEQPDTYIEVDENAKWEIKAADLHSRCGWTPFEGWQAQGKVRKVVLRGKVAYEDGKVLAEPGSGKNVRD